jgi:F-type H+-transporting ATPase subunit delta
MEIVKAILQNQISDITMKFLEIIFKSRREVILPTMAKQYIIMYNELIGLKKVNLISAADLEGGIKKKIINILEEQTKNKIELEESIQEDLIGGFILNIDDLQFDASIKTKLAKLKIELSQQY